jgi:quercetin dioxygenase-like cupin family protein
VDDAVLGASVALAGLLDYQPHAVVSRTLVETPGCTVTLFAFDSDQGLSEHSAPFHAMVQVLDGRATISIGGTPHQLTAGDAIVMPANVPHAVRAQTPFKMLLTMARAQI